MKRATYLVLVGCLLSTSRVSYSQVQKQQLGVVDGEPMVKFDFRQDKGDIDDQIIELARQGNANFIADATRFPVQSEAISTNSNDYLGDFILVMAHQRDLPWVKHGPRTFLFWADQDLVPIARLMLAEEEARNQGKTPDAIEKEAAQYKPPDNPDEQAHWNAEIAPALNDYFQRVGGWDGHSPDFKWQVRLADLPPALRGTLMARVRKELQTPFQMAFRQKWFGDDVWSRAWLKRTKSISGYNKKVYGEDATDLYLFDAERPGERMIIGTFSLGQVGVQ